VLLFAAVGTEVLFLERTRSKSWVVVMTTRELLRLIFDRYGVLLPPLIAVFALPPGI